MDVIDNPSKSGRERSLANLTPWKPGHSGNPDGRPKTKLFRKRLVRAIIKKHGDVYVIDQIVENMATAAKGKTKDRVSAATLIRDTLDGKPGPDTEGMAGPTVIIINPTVICEDGGNKPS